jgi:hypothetical protein
MSPSFFSALPFSTILYVTAVATICGYCQDVTCMTLTLIIVRILVRVKRWFSSAFETTVVSKLAMPLVVVTRAMSHAPHEFVPLSLSLYIYI